MSGSRIALPLARLLIRLHPREFREQFGDEVELFVEERLRAAGRLPSAGARRAVAFAVLRDQVGSAVRARLPCARIGRRRNRGRRPTRRRRGMLRAAIQDLSAATRFFRRRPGPALVATGTLALGLGACTLFFSLADAVLLRPLPFEDPDRLVSLQNRYGENRTSLSPPDYVDRRDRASTLARSAAFTRVAVGLAGAGEPQQVTAHRVTRDFFDVLGVVPSLGRIVLPAEEGDDPGGIVVLSHALWASTFGADATVIGRTVRIDGRPHTVSAVMPRGFDFPRGSDVWMPLVFSPDELADDNRGNENLSMVARLALGATLDGASAEMAAIAAGVVERVPARADFLQRAGWGSHVEPLASELLGGSRPLLVVKLGRPLGWHRGRPSSSLGRIPE